MNPNVGQFFQKKPLINFKHRQLNFQHTRQTISMVPASPGGGGAGLTAVATGRRARGGGGVRTGTSWSGPSLMRGRGGEASGYLRLKKQPLITDKQPLGLETRRNQTSPEAPKEFRGSFSRPPSISSTPPYKQTRGGGFGCWGSRKKGPGPGESMWPPEANTHWETPQRCHEGGREGKPSPSRKKTIVIFLQRSAK